LKLRTSTSLTAAACTLCVVAASGTMAPQAIAATPVGSAVAPTVSRSYELTALPSPLLLASLSLGSGGTPPAMALGRAAAPSIQSVAAPAATVNDVLTLASLPVQNLWTVLTTFGQLTNFVTPLNKAMALVATGLTTGNWNVEAITAQVQAAIDVTITAIRNIINLPATIINHDIQAIGNVLNPTAQVGLTPATTLALSAATPNAATAQASSPINDFLKVASLPAQNAWTVVTTFGQLTNFVTPLNKAMALVATGLTTGNWNVDAIGAQVQAAIDVTATAVRNIINLPATIINHDIKTIGGIFNPPAQATAGSAVQTLRTANTPDSSTSADGAAADGAAAGKEKHSWESLQSAVRSAFESEVAAFDGTLPAAAEAPAEDAPVKDTPAEGTPAKDAPAKDTPAKDTEAKDPNKGESTKDTPAKDADKDQAAKDGKDSSADKKADDKKASVKDTDKKSDEKRAAKHDTAKKDTGTKDGGKDKDGEKSAAA
jgi:hypothetical protein